MAAKLKINFVSDVSCPWCAIGLSSLERALHNVDGDIEVDLHIEPFELNPQMPPGGEDIGEHLRKKYGSTPAQQADNFERIRSRGEEVDFIFSGKRQRIYNTFDAHRLLLWAGLPSTQPAGRQLALKKALLHAYFTHGESPESHAVLLRLAAEAGLDATRAGEILASDAYANEVRSREHYYTDAGIHSVPSVIINDRHLITGGQPVEVFENALRQIAAGE